MKKISIMIMLLVVAFASCKKTPEVNLKYVDVERDLITVGTTTATVQCDYQYIATLKKAFFYYGESETNMTSAEMRVVQNTLYVDLAGLSENTIYSYYYEFHNGFNSMRTALKTFKTEAGNGGGEEPPTPPEIMLPTVITTSVTEITSNSAKGGGEVTNDGGSEVTERGICWSTNANPTLDDSHIAIGTGMGEFTAMVSGLEENTTYHVRAYAINEKGTAYGLDREFTTLEGGGSGEVPTGAINGLFTINENGDQVYFSRGNLQYTISTQTWSFMEHQYDMVELSGQDVGTNYANQDIVSLFGWGTSGWNNGNMYYQPYNTERFWDGGYGYGPIDETNYIHSLTGDYSNADWGVYNSILNGNNSPGQWRTLTRYEWDYVLFSRITSSDIRFAKAIVDSVNGVILLPDNWNTLIYTLNYPNKSNAPFNINIIGADIWATMESNGAVFLPTSGGRVLSSVVNAGSCGYYWSSSIGDRPSEACHLVFGNSELRLNPFSNNAEGHSVRLVQDANK